MSAFHTALAQAMETAGLTEQQLATRMGVSQPTVHRLVSGITKNPPVKTVEKAELALGLKRHKLWKLLHGDQEKGKEATNSRSLPLLGTNGNEATEVFDFSEQICQPGRVMLRVEGDGMRGAGIFDGDYVAIDPTPTPVDGQTVVARVAGRAVVKLLAKVGSALRLVSANDEYAPIDLGEYSEILGVVVAVVRIF